MRNQRILAGAACLLVGSLISWVMPLAAANVPKAEDAVVATVNGSPIHAGELEWQWRRYLRKSGNGGNIDDLSRLGRGEFLEGLIRQEIAVQAALAAGFAVDAKAISEEINILRAQFVDDATFSGELAQLGLSEELLRRHVEKSLLVRWWTDETFVRQQPVSEAEALAWYQQNGAQLQRPEQVCARHLLVKIAPRGEEGQRQQAQDRAEMMRRRWLAGESFTDLCRQFSECPSAAREEGLGCFSRDEMVAPFAVAAFSLQPWEVSRVVETPEGFHLIQVYERKEAAVPPFAELRQQIIDQLRTVNARPLIETDLEAKRREAVVEILPAP